ncbi:hypothetical protein GCM10022243_38530 [Saccharothrix violaceirubra]|uniref:Transcriptional regulator with XRE-family HTH domain/tetratricopeptide (TPR) repeat protein n=1 Tax=Saccharothrix violaceirubra TaxID=413306 RepID=A0A7W7T1J2_9PSEU|nr:helix-turn-helix domain-containing protein [Saccharothrix violaceirubra]MBB4964362.1 transcriptional regulator with XRE-family HTH domain/tetratricopeptide (TPR) repeat protein [Saccharothrix violaceirubra]
MTFGDLLRGYRLRVRLTQEELAERSGVSVRAISDMERGRARGPQRRTVEALAAVLALGDDDRAGLLAAAKDGRARKDAAPVRLEPCALPPDVVDLTGREGESEVLRRLADQAGRTEVVVVHGPPGAGKTSLAVRAGYALTASFPDGCFFFHLRGMDPRPLHPSEVVHRMLLALGVAEDRMPGSEAERTDLYRELLRSRSTLLVLDDAADEAQVRPLLATGERSLVVVTSRAVLGGLAATRLGLDVLAPRSSVALLETIAGDRVRREPDAARSVAGLCGHLPLALRIAGNRLASRPRWTVGHLAEKLTDERRRLSALTAGDLRVRPAFEMSYRQLDDTAARLFRRLSLVPGRDFAPETVAVLADVDPGTAEDTLEELVDVSLVASGEVPGRYLLHDLVRVFAGERLADEEPDVGSTRHRMVSWLLARAAARARRFDPEALDAGPRDRADADAWLRTETPNWLGALRIAAETSMHAETLDLATAMHWYSDHRGLASTWEEVFTAGVAAARALGSRRDEAVQLNFLTWTVSVLLRRREQALTLFEPAWQAAVESGDVVEQGWAKHYRAASEMRLGEFEPARRHSAQARDLFHEVGYVLGETIALSCHSLVLHELGRFQEAADAHLGLVADLRADRVRIAPAVRDEIESSLLLRAASSLSAIARWAEVLDLASEAFDLAVRSSASGCECEAGYLRGLALLRLGRPAEAQAVLDRALSIAVEQRHPREDDIPALLAEAGRTLDVPTAVGEYPARAADVRSTDR